MPRPKNPRDKADYYEMLKWLFETLNEFGEQTEITEVKDENINDVERKTKELIDKGYFYTEGKLVPPGTDPSEFIMHMVTDKRKGYEDDHTPYVHILSKKNNNYVYFSTIAPKSALISLAEDSTNYPNANVVQGMQLVKDVVNKLYKDLNSTKRPWSSDSDDFKKVDEKLQELRQRMDYLTTLTNQQERGTGQVEISKYTYQKLADDFNNVLSAIGDYTSSHAKIKELSSRQINRLEIMNTIQSTYENIQLIALKDAEAKKADPNAQPLTFTSKNIDAQIFNDKLTTLKIRQSGEGLYHAALTDRNLYRSLRKYVQKNTPEKVRKIIHEKLNKQKIKIDDLNLDSFYSIDNEIIKDKDHNFVGNEKVNYEKIAVNFTAQFNTKGFRKKYLDSKTKELSAEDIYNDLVSDERAMLHAIAKDRDAEYKKLEALKKNDPDKDINENKAIKELAQATEDNHINTVKNFIDDMKKGKVIVFDKNGKFVPQSAGLRTVADRISHPDNNPAYYRWDEQSKSYIAREFEFSAHSTVGEVSGLKANPNKEISGSYFLVCNQVLEDVGKLWDELDSAKSFYHSSEHNKMKDALDDIYNQFDKVNFTENKSLQLKDAFSKLADTAETYIQLHSDGNINQKQRTRLSVAQRIITINEVLGDTKLTYDKYLKTMYAKKIMLDAIAVKNDETQDKLNGEEELKAGETIKRVLKDNIFIGTQLCKTTKYAKEYDIKNIMKSEAFKEATDGKSTKELKEMLKEGMYESYNKVFHPVKPKKEATNDASVLV